MHLSRPGGCADADNLADLEEYTTRRYPRIKWILAHCARSFTYWPIREAIERLCEMPNIWYDLSAVTTMPPFLTLFQKEDLKRIFLRLGRRRFSLLPWKVRTVWEILVPGRNPMNPKFNFAHTDARPVLCIYEQIMAMKQAAEIAGPVPG